MEVTFVDLRKRPIALGELKRFVERLGAAALLDTEGKQYKDLGLGYMSLDPDQIVARLMVEELRFHGLRDPADTPTYLDSYNTTFFPRGTDWSFTLAPSTSTRPLTAQS